MTRSITIASNAVICKLMDADNEARIVISKALSYHVLGYENTFAYKNKTWDGTSTMFSWEKNSFPRGFLKPVSAALAKNGYKVRLMSKTLPEPLGKLPRTLGGFSYTDKYDYQWKGVRQLEDEGMMIARLATGAGKTFLAALAYTKIKRPTLILTKRMPLLYQFEERLKDFGYNAGIIGDGIYNPNPDLTVAMAQTLNNRLDDPATIEYLKTVEFLIGEEAHEVSDDTYWNVIKRCPNAYYKLGLTATPFMKESDEANMKLLGAFGPVGMKVSEKLLIDRGVNATPKIKFMPYEAPSKCRFNSNYHKAMEFGIVHCEGRNNAILEQVLNAKKRKLPALVLIGRQDHGKVLQALFAKNGIRSKFIFGESNQKKRKDALKELNQGKLDVLIGSTILDVGVDVPTIGVLVIASAGKAEVGYRQRIGRGLRSKPSGPNICMVVDFMDEHNMHLNGHYRERLNIIRSTPGFAENLLSIYEQLPWDLFD